MSKNDKEAQEHGFVCRLASKQPGHRDRARVTSSACFSAFVYKVDTPDPNVIFGDLSDTFGELLAEFDAARGWVTSVAWSPKAPLGIFWS